MYRLILFFTMFLTASGLVAKETTIELASGTELIVYRHGNQGENLMLWLPSTHGMREPYHITADKLVSLGYDVIALALQESYMVPVGRGSLDVVKIEDLLDLVSQLQSEGYRNIFITTSGRGAQLALHLALKWQQRHSESLLLKGILFISPHFIKSNQETDKAIRYVEIANKSNLPVYLLQPELSTKYVRIAEIKRHLMRGGSQVFVHLLKDVRDGFHLRPVEDLNQIDLETRARLASIADGAFRMLSSIKPSQVDKKWQGDIDKKQQQNRKVHISGMHPFLGDKRAPAIELKTIDNTAYRLDMSKGKVVLVNFWASWCGPCVKEIPSLMRLKDRMKGKAFEIITINIGETKEAIEEFRNKITFDLPILMDEKSETVRNWHVYAYPSNYLLDAKGNIQYSYKGALEWDADVVIKLIDSLIENQALDVNNDA